MPVLTLSVVDTNEKSAIKLTNNGVGVAIFGGTIVTPKNAEWKEVFSLPYKQISWKLALGYLTHKKIEEGSIAKHNQEFLCSDTLPNYTLGAGNSKELVLFDPGIRNLLSSNLNNYIEVSTCYCSVYDDCWITTFGKGFKEARNCDGYTAEKIVHCG